MAKQPYIPFYLGDYIKDTRKLPLAARGAWVDLILFMWNEPIKGEITATINEFAAMLACSKEECEFALSLLVAKKVCDHEKLADGSIKIICRRMRREAEISLKRSESGKSGANIKKEKQANAQANVQAKPKQNTEYGIANEIDTEIEIPFGKSENLLPQMVRIFKDSYPQYPEDANTDFTSCLEIAHKIAKSNGWSKESVTNGKMKNILEQWRTIVSFSRSDTWFCTRSISDFNKEFQRLMQKITNGTANRGNNQQSQLTKQTITATASFGQL